MDWLLVKLTQEKVTLFPLLNPTPSIPMPSLWFSLAHQRGLAAISTTPPLSHLEVENPCIVFNKTLIMGYNSEKQSLVQGQASNGCKKPAVPCMQTQT